ncbi:MAG TPA: cobalamin biosynthesis protein [Micromonosporaceae bacterium]
MRWLGLLLGAGLDVLIADPRRAHPVAVFGRAATAVESRIWADARGRGVVFALGCVGSAATAGLLVERASRWTPLRVAVVALSTWAVLGGTTLAREALTMSRLLDNSDLPAAREHLAHLCGRDASMLDTAELARGTVESVAENTSDAVVAPLFWGAVAGTPGLLAYRAVNTLDAMVGHHNPRYERFGWAAAKLDDLANLIPARLTGILAAGLAPLVGGSPVAALRAMRRDGGNHPSPNAGQCEAAFAGALGVRLGGTNVYGDAAQQRGPLGDGRRPEPADIARAVRLSRAVGIASVALAAGMSWFRSWSAGRRG